MVISIIVKKILGRDVFGLKNKILLIVLPGLLFIDQATKDYVVRTMDLYYSIPVVDNFFNITYLRNKGAAFGIFANSSFRLPLLILASVVAVAALIAVFRKLRADDYFSAISLTFILSGAIGNLIDRVRLGEVTDFLDVYWRGYHWPAFNFADSAICLGVVLVVLGNIINEKACVCPIKQ
jgi:signal peptidase II